MFNPLRPLKNLPWSILFQVAIVAVVLRVLVEWILALLICWSSLFQMVVQSVMLPPTGLLLPLVVAGLTGSIAVWVLERWPHRVRINNGILWALVVCVLVGLRGMELLPIAPLDHLPRTLGTSARAIATPEFRELFGTTGTENLFPVVLGTFWAGVRYWR